MNTKAGSAMAGLSALTLCAGTAWTVDIYAASHLTNSLLIEDNTGSLGAEVSDNVGYCPWLDAFPRLTLEPDAVCYNTNGTVTVEIWMRDVTETIVGGQFFLAYDNTVLDFTTNGVGDPPFTTFIYEDMDEAAGTIDYAVGIAEGGSGTAVDTKMAFIEFTALTEVCYASDLVWFRPHEPPTRLADDDDGAIEPVLLDLTAITIDATGPTVTAPDATELECSTDLPAAATTIAEFLALTGAAASDNCTAQGDLTVGSVTGSLVGTECLGTITRTYTITDACSNTTTVDHVFTVSDDTDPTIYDCPVDITTNADAGGCTAVVSWTAPTADDNCGLDTLTPDHAPGSTFSGGTTTVTYTATDDCGNTAECSFIVTVEAYSEMEVVVELSPMMWDPNAAPGDTLTRCITFELWECPDTAPVFTVSEAMVFPVDTGSSHVATATLEVPCAYDYSCITARDAQHTLRSTDDDDFGMSGDVYVADFTGNRDTGGDWLVGGNLNDDYVIDILDYGSFVIRWGEHPDPNTDCSTSGFHVDINGSGEVDTADFTFIQINFLDEHEANCCGQPDYMGDPLTEISIADLYDLGLGELAAADLNGDGWLDEGDIVAFLDGARPRPQGPDLRRRDADIRVLDEELDELDEVEEAGLAPSFDITR